MSKCTSFCVDIFHFSWKNMLERDCESNDNSNFSRNQQFSKVSVPFDIPISNVQTQQFLHILGQMCYFCIVIVTAIKLCAKWNLIVILTSISLWLMIWASFHELIDHLSLFEEMSIQSLHPFFKIGVFIFCFRVVKSSPYILTTIPYQLYDLQILSPISGLSFHFLYNVLLCTNVYNFGEAQLSCFFFCWLCFWWHS